MQTNSRLRPAIDKLLRDREGISLDELVARERGFGSSWPNISRRIYALTGDIFDVDPSTLYRWYERDERPEKAAV